VIFLGALSLYGYFVFYLWRGLHLAQRHQPDLEAVPSTHFSIVIAAHNEEDQIPNTIASLVNQSYPTDQYEIILSADRCTDQTVERARQAAGKFPNFTVLNIKEHPEHFAPKKFALEQAIKQARFSTIVAMDADCQASQDYLTTLNHYFTAGAQVVLNIPKVRLQRSILHRYLLPERLLTWGIATAATGWQKPFLAFGGSWAYTLEALKQAGGFREIAHSLSGDDDLLIARMARTGATVRVCLNPRGWVLTDLPTTWRAFVRQRRRHHSAGKMYPFRVQVGYALFHLSNLMIWISPLFASTGFLLLGIKFLADYWMLTILARLFRETVNILSFLIFEPGYLLHHLLVAPSGFLGKIRWK